MLRRESPSRNTSRQNVTGSRRELCRQRTTSQLASAVTELNECSGSRGWLVQASAASMLAKSDSFFALVIAVNGLVIVIETDLRSDVDAGIGWFVADSAFTCIFLFELILRIIVFQRQWLYSPWNIFDAALVATSVADSWILPLLALTSHNMRIFTTLRVLRIFRMLRILRLVRLLKFARQLVLLTDAMWGALRTTTWFILLLFWVLFMFGLMLTSLVGKQDDLALTIDDVQLFSTLPRSVLTLFQFTTLEAWPDITRSSLEPAPWLSLLFVVFIVFTNVTLLNTVAGVLVENVLSVSRADDEEQQLALDRKLDEQAFQMGLELAQFDANRNGLLDLHELRSVAAVGESKVRTLLQLTGMSLDEAEVIFHMLDHDGTGAVNRVVFVDFMLRARGHIKVKHILAVSRDIRQLDLQLTKTSRRISGLSEILEGLEELVDEEGNDAVGAESIIEPGVDVCEGFNVGICMSASGVPSAAAGDGDTAAGGAFPTGQRHCGNVNQSDEDAVHPAVVALRREFVEQLRALELRL